MIALGLCVIAFIASFYAGRRSLGLGLSAVLFFGYTYGILRANLLTAFSHFIFDCALIGLFASQTWASSNSAERKRIGTVTLWVTLLIGWCALIFFLPFQPLMVSLVGLRGNTLFLPAIILGARLKEKDLMQFSSAFAVLNLFALIAAVAEYRLGVPRFYPISPVTEIIYHSQDVAGGFYRIPAIFTSAHAYGGTMVDSLPFLIGGWSRVGKGRLRLLLLSGSVAAMLGILFSATRLNFVIGSAMMAIAVCIGQRNRKNKIILLGVIAIIGVVAATNSRFGRFKTLDNADAVEGRISGSVNRSFFQILVEHPMGNGLGGGGTSMPYFLAGEVRNPIGIENEYGRILCEQGVIGLLLWIGFVLWFLSRGPMAFQFKSWAISRKMIWCLLAFQMCSMVIGVGFLTAIPGTLIQLLGIGWTATAPAPERKLRTSTDLAFGGSAIRSVPAFR